MPSITGHGIPPQTTVASSGPPAVELLDAEELDELELEEPGGTGGFNPVPLDELELELVHSAGSHVVSCSRGP